MPREGQGQGRLFAGDARELSEGRRHGQAAELGKSAESHIVEMVAGARSRQHHAEEGHALDAGAGRPAARLDRPGRGLADGDHLCPAGAAESPAAHGRSCPPARRASARPAAGPLLCGARVHAATAVEDRVFARRAYLDVIGLLPTPEQLERFLADPSPDKRASSSARCSPIRRGYADHWLTFWNDLLRNDYKGAGFIDGGRKQITEWLYDALLDNKPYDQFVAELMNPDRQGARLYRGHHLARHCRAAMLPPMQAAQSVSQVFLGVNLKCASCHD